MKKIRIYLFFVAVTTVTAGCKLDNYDYPDAKIHGAFYDVETLELVEQDIINGTVIEYVEEGYSSIETMVVKNDGTYRNNLIFSGQYTVTPVRGNFEPIEPQIVNIKGDFQLDFFVKPYIRLKNVSISKSGDKVRASFWVEQTGYDNILRVGLFVSREPSVGNSIHTVKIEIPVGMRYTEEQQFTIIMDIPTQLKPVTGASYFFRVGALIDVPESKYNYAKAVRLEF